MKEYLLELIVQQVWRFNLTYCIVLMSCLRHVYTAVLYCIAGSALRCGMPWFVVLYHTMWYCTTSHWNGDVFCCTIPISCVCCCISLYCLLFYCIVLHWNTFYCIVMYCIVMYRIVMYCYVMYCIVLYCIVLYSIVLYCIV